jgi:hypothetical protein
VRSTATRVVSIHFPCTAAGPVRGLAQVPARGLAPERGLALVPARGLAQVRGRVLAQVPVRGLVQVQVLAQVHPVPGRGQAPVRGPERPGWARGPVHPVQVLGRAW